MKNDYPEVFKTRSKCMRYDYLVRNVVKRAILVVIIAEELKYSEFEKYWLVLAAAEVAKNNNWKAVVVEIHYHNVFCNNAAHGKEIKLGHIDEVVESRHFLNDDYYSPKGFWIKNTNQHIDKQRQQEWQDAQALAYGV